MSSCQKSHCQFSFELHTLMQNYCFRQNIPSCPWNIGKASQLALANQHFSPSFKRYNQLLLKSDLIIVIINEDCGLCYYYYYYRYTIFVKSPPFTLFHLMNVQVFKNIFTLYSLFYPLRFYIWIFSGIYFILYCFFSPSHSLDLGFSSLVVNNIQTLKPF